MYFLIYPNRVWNIITGRDRRFAEHFRRHLGPILQPSPLLDELLEHFGRRRYLAVQILLYPRPQISLIVLEKPVARYQKAFHVIGHRYHASSAHILTQTKAGSFGEDANLWNIFRYIQNN